MKSPSDGTVEVVLSDTVGGHGFLPVDRRQALRIRRYLMGAATSLLVILIFFLSAWFDIVALDAAIRGTAGICALIVLFFIALRSGLNLRLRDPSLTTEQIGAAVLVLAYFMYSAPRSQSTLIILYLVALMFGVLRLATARMLALAALTLVAHTLVVWLSFRRYPGFDLNSGILQLVVLGIVLPWFAVMGGYVNRLRSRLSDSNHTLTKAVDRIEQIAIRDVLTGVFNRRHLIDTLERERSRAMRVGSPLSLCLVDIDHFKNVNDTYGHAAGDVVLAHFAMLASIGLRANDVFGRYGGEEFLLMLPDTDVKGAAAAAERIRARVEESACPAAAASCRVTVTIGVAGLAAGENVESLIARADKGLYAGKEAGRNRVMPV